MPYYYYIPKCVFIMISGFGYHKIDSRLDKCLKIDPRKYQCIFIYIYIRMHIFFAHCKLFSSYLCSWASRAASSEKSPLAYRAYRPFKSAHGKSELLLLNLVKCVSKWRCPLWRHLNRSLESFQCGSSRVDIISWCA